MNSRGNSQNEEVDSGIANAQETTYLMWHQEAQLSFSDQTVIIMDESSMDNGTPASSETVGNGDQTRPLKNERKQITA